MQSHICDKKLELERQKLVEQAKRIARPSKGKRPLDEIRLFNSMVLGIQNYFQLATCISIDCRKIHRQVMTVLTNRLNTETGCKLVREGGAMTESEKERFGKSAMVRYVSGVCIRNRPTYLPYRIYQEQDTDGKENSGMQLYGRWTGIDTHKPKPELICSGGIEKSTIYGSKHRTHRQQDFIILCSTWEMCAKWRTL